MTILKQNGRGDKTKTKSEFLQQTSQCQYTRSSKFMRQYTVSGEYIVIKLNIS